MSSHTRNPSSSYCDSIHLQRSSRVPFLVPSFCIPHPFSRLQPSSFFLHSPSLTPAFPIAGFRLLHPFLPLTPSLPLELPFPAYRLSLLSSHVPHSCLPISGSIPSLPQFFSILSASTSLPTYFSIPPSGLPIACCSPLPSLPPAFSTAASCLRNPFLHSSQFFLPSLTFPLGFYIQPSAFPSISLLPAFHITSLPKAFSRLPPDFQTTSSRLPHPSFSLSQYLPSTSQSISRFLHTRILFQQFTFLCRVTTLY